MGKIGNGTRADFERLLIGAKWLLTVEVQLEDWKAREFVPGELPLGAVIAFDCGSQVIVQRLEAYQPPLDGEPGWVRWSTWVLS